MVFVFFNGKVDAQNARLVEMSDSYVVSQDNNKALFARIHKNYSLLLLKIFINTFNYCLIRKYFVYSFDIILALFYARVVFVE